MSQSSVSTVERYKAHSPLVGYQQSRQPLRCPPPPVSFAYASDPVRDREFANLNRAVDAYGSLAPNWDSYGAQPLDRASRDFLHGSLRLAENYVRIPPPVLSPIDGGALLEWNLSHGVSAYVEISDHSIVFVVRRDGCEIADGADTAFSIDAIERALKAIHCEMVAV